MDIQATKHSMVFSLSVVGHLAYLMWLSVFIRQIPVAVLQLTPIGVSPLPVYSVVIAIGHLYIYTLQSSYPRLAMVLYLSMVYTALVTGLILWRLSMVNYGS